MFPNKFFKILIIFKSLRALKNILPLLTQLKLHQTLICR